MSDTKLRCVWPILDDTIDSLDAVQEAVDDLDNVAQRSHFQVAEVGRIYVASGRAVPGSGGARRVVVIECTGEVVDHYAAARKAWLQVVS